MRPGSHKLMGGAFLALALIVFVLDYAGHFEVELLPGAPSPLYLMLGLVLAGVAGWSFGIFDRTSTR
ncbi:MAG: hypothetical protein ACRDUY_11750 [Nitriliruptorales bacterium]